jgi:hypothetical protein
MESYRYSTEGYELRNNDMILDPRDIDVMSLLSNAIGLPSTEINKIKWTRGQQYELEQWFSKQSGQLRREYVEASQRRDRERMSEIRQEWRELQDSKDRVRPFFNDEPKTLRRQGVGDLLKAPREQARRERQTRAQMGTN